MDERDQYQLCVDAYTGGGGFLDGSYLDRFSLSEDSEDFSLRRKSAYYDNYIRGIIASATEPVFGDKVQRSNMPTMYEAFTNNCDMRGTSLTTFLKNVSAYHKLLDNVYIIMDNSGTPSVNVQDAVNTRSYPYLYYKLPHEVEGVNLGTNGEVVSITFYVATKTIDNKERKIKRTITNTMQCDWYTGDNGKPQTYGAEVEVKSTRVIMTGSEVCPIPPFLSLSQISRAIYNMNSEQRDLERTQAFNILQVPSDEPEKAHKIGSKNVLYVPVDGTRDAKYISPDSNVLQVLNNSSEKIINRLRDQARSMGFIISDKYKSGTAISMDTAPLYAIMANLSALFNSIEYKLRDMFSMMSGESNSAEIIYNKDYSPSPDKLQQDYITLFEALKEGVFDDSQTAVIRDKAFDNLRKIAGL